MSISTHVIGFRPPDEKYNKMRAVYESCKQAGIDPPEEVDEFFEWGAPDDNGTQVEIENVQGVVTKYSGSASEGYDVHVQKLPKDVTIVRVYNSW